MKSALRPALVALMLIAAPAVSFGQSLDLADVVGDIGTSDYYSYAAHAGSENTVRVVRLSTLFGAKGNTGWVANRIATQEEAIRFLQRQLAFNQAALWAIGRSNVELQDIVGVYASGDGAVVLYADDL